LTRQQRFLALVLSSFGCFDCLALIAVLLPGSVLHAASLRLGLAPLPADPLVGYLARSASLMYALHGATVLFVSFDMLRYWELIRFLALLAIVHGLLILGIDLAEGMPGWWQIVEGPSFSLTGIVVLLLQRTAGTSSASLSPDAATERGAERSAITSRLNEGRDGA
jgi:hypothetical protein